MRFDIFKASNFEMGPFVSSDTMMVKQCDTFVRGSFEDC